MDILFKNDDFVFSYRVGGILIHDGKILLQRPKNDDYAIIGGHVVAMETSMETLKREFEEELHASIEVDNLFAIGEIYFPYLISQRSANRPTYPLMWECVGGSVVKGEDSLQGAIREAKEEVGVDLMPENGQVLFTKTRKIIEGKIFNDIMDVWLFDYDGEVDLGNATTDEVAQVAWMNREQIKELFDANMFVDTLEYFFMEVDKKCSKISNFEKN